MRQKYYSTAMQAINQGIRNYGNDSILKFYYAISLILQGYRQLTSILNRNFCNLFKKLLERIHEAVKELDSLKTKEDVGIGSLLALTYAHKKFSSLGK